MLVTHLVSLQSQERILADAFGSNSEYTPIKIKKLFFKHAIWFNMIVLYIRDVSFCLIQCIFYNLKRLEVFIFYTTNPITMTKDIFVFLFVDATKIKINSSGFCYANNSSSHNWWQQMVTIQIKWTKLKGNFKKLCNYCILLLLQ